MAKDLSNGLQEFLATKAGVDSYASWIDLELPLLAGTPSATIDGRIYHLATANLVINGIKYDPHLRSVGAIRRSVDRAVERCTVSIENITTEFGANLLGDINVLHGATVRVGRHWRDPKSGAAWVEQQFTGTVDGAKGNEQQIELEVLTDLYAARSIGGGRQVERLCQAVFNSPSVRASGSGLGAACGYTGGDATCTKTSTDCNSKSNLHRFQGFVEIDSSATATSSAIKPLVNYQLVRDDGDTTQTMRPVLKFVGATITDNATDKQTEIEITGGEKLGWIYADDYAGVDATGGSDSATGLQNLFNDVNVQGQRIYFRPGLYLCSTDIDLTQVLDTDGSIVVEGSGDTHTIIRFTGTGNGFVGGTQRCDAITFRNLKIESNNAGNTGDGFNFTGVGGVQTRILLDRVSIFGFGGWAYRAINTQSSVIQNCHFRGMKKGHIALIDNSVGDGTAEPNANIIQNNLLDNPTKDVANEACIKLYNAKGTTIQGNTIQGYWVGASGGSPAIAPAIHVEEGRQTLIAGNWFEGLNSSAAIVYAKDTRNLTCISNRYSGLNALDIDLANVKGATFIGENAENSIPHFSLDASCQQITVQGGYYSSPWNLTKNDNSRDGLRIQGVSYHAFTAYSSTYDIENQENGLAQPIKNYLSNGGFALGTTGWTGAATGVTRQATGGPDNGPYILCNTQGLSDGGALGGTNFVQTYNVPNTFQHGPWTLAFDFYVEDFGAAPALLRWVDIEFSGSGFSGQAWRINSLNPNYVSGRWYTATLTDILTSGTGRFISVILNPTQGPNTPRVRFANFRLCQGVQAPREGGAALTDRSNTFWGANTFRNDLNVDAAGSSTGSPRTIGLTNMGSGTAARLTFGDAFNSLQNSNGGKMILQSYWGLKIRGNRQSGVLAGFETGNSGDPAVVIVSDTAGVSPLELDSTVSLGVPLLRVKNNGTTQLDVQSNGSLFSEGFARITDAYLDRYSATGSDAPIQAFRRHRGTVSSPAAVQNNDVLGYWGAYGQYSTTVGQRHAGAFFTFTATENFGASAAGTRFEVNLAPNGSNNVFDKGWTFDPSNNGGTFRPTANEVQDLGTASQSWRDTYSVHYHGQGSAPSISAGTGAGTGPTISISGTDTGFRVLLTTGTSPATNATIFTVTFTRTWATNPRAVFAPTNSNAAALSGNAAPYIDYGGLTTSVLEFKVGSSGLGASTAYAWDFIAVGI